MDWWKVSVLPFSVVVDEAWNDRYLATTIQNCNTLRTFEYMNTAD